MGQRGLCRPEGIQGPQGEPGEEGPQGEHDKEGPWGELGAEGPAGAPGMSSYIENLVDI